MRKLQNTLLVVLLFVGGFSMCVPNANGQIFDLLNVAVKGIGKLINITGDGTKHAVMLKVVKDIYKGTGEVSGKIGDLKGVCSEMSGDMNNLWRETNKFYNDLKVLSQGVNKYKDIIQFVGNTRDIQGYCGAAISLSSRSKYLTLSDYEFVMSEAIKIQEYTFNHLESLYSLLTKNGDLKMSDYERLQLLRELSMEQAKVLASSRNLVVYVKRLDMKYQSRAQDKVFRDSFLNMRL